VLTSGSQNRGWQNPQTRQPRFRYKSRFRGLGRFVAEYNFGDIRLGEKFQAVIDQKSNLLAVGCPPSAGYPLSVTEDESVGVGGKSEEEKKGDGFPRHWAAPS
jgi:hypothetical protein